MSSELRATFSLDVTKSNWNVNVPSISLTDDVSSNVAYSATWVIGTSYETLSIGDVSASSQSYLYLRNLDATNYVQIAVDDAGTATPFCRLTAGAFAFFKSDLSCTFKGKANTAPCNVQVLLLSL
jgi:hypothetical protein